MNQRPYNGPPIALPFNIRASEPRWSGFCPPMLPRLLAWYDLSQLGLADAAAIATLVDFSGNGNHAAAVGTGGTYKRPPFGMPYAYRDGTNGGWRKTFSAPVAQPITVFSVTMPLTTSMVQCLDGVTGGRLTMASSGGNWAWYGGNILTHTAVSPVHNITTTRYNGASFKARINGGAWKTGDIGAQQLAGITIGCDNNTTNGFSGRICEVIYYRGDIDDATCAFVEDYLLQKWSTYFRYPFTLPGLYGVWDGDYLVDPSVWPDYSGFGHNFTQANAAKQFAVTPNAIGAHTAAESDGTEKWMSCTFSSTVSQPVTVLAAMKIKSLAAWKRFVAGNAANAPTLYRDAGGKWTQFAGSGLTQAGLATTTNWSRIAAYFSGASSNMWLSGTAGTAGNTDVYGYGVGGGLRIGSDYDGTNAMSMQLAHIAVCRADIGAAGRAAFDAAMAQRYGL